MDHPSSVVDQSFAHRFVIVPAEPDDDGELQAVRTGRPAFIAAISGSPEGRLLGSPGDTIINLSGGLWQKISGSRTTTGWQLLGNPGDSSATVTTTDETPTTMDGVTLADNQTVIVEQHIVGVQSDGSERLAAINRAVAFRDGGGATLQGAINNAFVRESAGAGPWNASMFVTGNELRQVVEGVAATTITWIGRLFVTRTGG
ncbi:MAG: hypothetical protein K0U16_07185 [Gammaproteobacteria bacterium]|nr:hypothetical protein [Gammaproteobacteria bacterium]